MHKFIVTALVKNTHLIDVQSHRMKKAAASNLTAEQILIRSGNIGSVRIGQKLGEEKCLKISNKSSPNILTT